MLRSIGKQSAECVESILSVPCLLFENGAFCGYGYDRTLIGGAMLEDSLIGSRRNGNEAVAQLLN